MHVIGTVRSKTAASAKSSFNIASLCFSKRFVIIPLCSTGRRTELRATCVFVSSLQLEIWPFNVADLQRTGKKCTKLRSERAEGLFCSS